MSAQQTDFEIADTIVLELLNEHSFMSFIQPYVKETVKNYGQTKELETAILDFCQHKVVGVLSHSYNLPPQNDRIHKIVTVEVLKHYWEQYIDKKFIISQHIPAPYHDVYVKKSIAKRAEPKPIVEVDMAELEIRVLAKYETENTGLKTEVSRRMLNKTWADKTRERLLKYVSGAWAWNTLCNEFIKYMPLKHIVTSGRAYAKPELQAHIDMFMMHVYAQNFTRFYKTKFDMRDAPPQCGYLLDWSILPKHDDVLDANTYMLASEQLQTAKERQFTKQFKQPTEDSTMNLIKIETVTFINSERASDLSDDKIFALISTIEKDIDKLQAVREKPKKLIAKIAAMKESVSTLGKIVDDRD